MRIPLDYYRILSVPIKATEQQLAQAYDDRLLQKPRREYNEQAVEARQELIQQAYRVLSDPIEREAYDAQFLGNVQLLELPGSLPEVLAVGEMAAPETDHEAEAEIVADNSLPEMPQVNSTIKIPSEQVVGALSIMHELGEYELVLTQGIDYYNSVEFAQFQQRQAPELSQAMQENIILALALAYMELGREQWHRREYESAAVSTQLGIDLLNQENLFPQVREELEIDLDKLRPYRVLELISQNPANSAPRAKGFLLLQEMLQQRQGIEGKGEDRSGLNFERFLCFIQQLRTYLTSAEQQELFDQDRQTDSAIASYLAVYALLGQGFSHKLPELILRAQRKLDYLSLKQDVTWEQAVSALLLGHTEKAIQKIYQSQDTTKLNQILQHTPDSKDLLPGMCFYSEKWLLEDVLAQFVDLAATKLTLKEYFADREVQNYLDQLTPATVLVTTETAFSSEDSGQSTSDLDAINQSPGVGILSRWRSIFADKTASTTVIASNQIIQTGEAYPRQGTATLERGHQHPTRQAKGSGKHYQPKVRVKPKSRPTIGQPHNPHHRKSAKPSIQPLSLPLESPQRAVPAAVMRKAKAHAQQKTKSNKPKNPATLLKGWLFVFSFVLGTGLLAFIVVKTLLKPASQTANQAQLAIAISTPTVELPTIKAKPVVVKPKLTFTETSQQVIEKWLNSKSAAFGKNHQIDSLNSILAEPLLSTWRKRATDYQTGNLYREYQHQVKMRSAQIDPNNPNQAVVEAEVKEVAQHYQAGQLNNAESYDDNLLVRYQLIRQGNQWLIQNAEVVKTL